MKINPYACGILRIRVVVFFLAVVGMTGLGFSFGESLTVCSGQSTAIQSQVPTAPTVDMSYLVSAIR